MKITTDKGREYELPEELGQFFWDSLYKVDPKADRQELVNVLAEKFTPVFNQALESAREDGWQAGYDKGVAPLIDPYGIGDNY